MSSEPQLVERGQEGLMGQQRVVNSCIHIFVPKVDLNRGYYHKAELCALIHEMKPVVWHLIGACVRVEVRYTITFRHILNRYNQDKLVKPKLGFGMSLIINITNVVYFRIHTFCFVWHYFSETADLLRFNHPERLYMYIPNENSIWAFCNWYGTSAPWEAFIVILTNFVVYASCPSDKDELTFTNNCLSHTNNEWQLGQLYQTETLDLSWLFSSTSSSGQCAGLLV